MTHNLLLSSKMLLRALLATHTPETCLIFSVWRSRCLTRGH